LAAKAFDLCHGNALNTDFRQRRTDIVQLEGFDYGNDHFHAGRLQVRPNTKSTSRNSKEIAAVQHGVFDSTDV
jgi:hypothetical protein